MNFGSNNFGGNFHQVHNGGGSAIIRSLRTAVESQKITIQNLNALIARLKGGRP